MDGYGVQRLEGMKFDCPAEAVGGRRESRRGLEMGWCIYRL
jgi:hypothetical protein